MVNNTVNGKKIGRAAGYRDKTVVKATAVQQKEKELETNGALNIPTVALKFDALMQAGEFVSIKAYNGGNPNKIKEKSKTDSER